MIKEFLSEFVLPWAQGVLCAPLCLFPQFMNLAIGGVPRLCSDSGNEGRGATGEPASYCEGEVAEFLSTSGDGN